MIKKLTLTQIYKSDKDKNGKLLQTRDGRSYTKLAIKCREYGDKWISGFVSGWNHDWKEGMVVGATVEENGDFLNLKRPDPVAELEERVKDLEDWRDSIIMNEESLDGGHVEDKHSEKDESLPF